MHHLSQVQLPTRPMPSRRAFVAWAAASLAAPVLSETAPPLRLIVSLAAGGPSDRAARTLAAALATETGRAVGVENMPGGGGATAARALLAEPAPGQALLFTPASTAGLALTLEASPFASLADLDLLAAVGGNRLCLYVHPALGVDTLSAFVAQARRERPRMGQITLGESLITTQLMRAGGFGVEQVPYTGSPQMLKDLVDGRLQAALLPSCSGVAQVEAGGLRMLACASDQRIVALPQVPTMAEAGVADLRAPTAHLIVAAPGMSADDSTALSEALLRAAARPEVVAEFHRLHLDGPALDRQQTLALVRETEAVWRQFVRDAGIAAQ